MSNNITTSKSFNFFIAISVAILTTGFLRLQLFTGLPDLDDGLYVFINQYIYHALSNGEDLKGMTIQLYQMMTFWLYGLEVNQYISLRLIDGLLAVAASFIFFKVILKESGSILFTVILTTILFIVMSDIEIMAYGYKNSVWAAYIPLFTALLVWQKASKVDSFSFYIIGALVSLGVLLREPFLPFFLLAGVAIFISYGWRVLVKYLVGSAILGFSVFAVVLSFRGWDLIDLLNSYFSQGIFGAAGLWWIWDIDATSKLVLGWALNTIKTSWFICITALASIIYLVKAYSADKKSVNMNRFYFWLAVALIPLLEWFFKYGLPYHIANCLPGLVGLSAMGWRYINSNESKQVTTSSIVVISLVSLFIIMPTISRTIIKSDYIYTPSEAIKRIGSNDTFRAKNIIERSQYLQGATKVYELSSEDSTLSVNNFWQPLYPLTGLLPPTVELCCLRQLFISLSYDEEKMIKIIEKHRPTLIFLAPASLMDGEGDFIAMVEKTNLYNKVGYLPVNLEIDKGYLSGTIYRLKDFK